MNVSEGFKKTCNVLFGQEIGELEESVFYLPKGKMRR
jgi:hypothetical protein